MEHYSEHQLFLLCIKETLEEAKRCLINNTVNQDRVIVMVESVVSAIEDYCMDDERMIGFARYATQELDLLRQVDGVRTPRARGRPPIDIDINNVETLLSMNFRATEVARMYGIAIQTLHSKLRRHGISVRTTYSSIADHELSELMTQILLEFPNTGYKRMRGYLLSRGHKIAELRVRQKMRELDPEGVYERAKRNRAIVRRVYYVPYTNDLWHIDTNLKLRRWKMVMKAGIDGKSRLCTYIEMGGDNTAQSHYEAFKAGTRAWGIPSRCRSDKGGENMKIAKFMLENRGTGRGSHICARSVHNQRIERYWRDTTEGCMKTFKGLFLNMEQDGMLNPEDDVDMRILHYIFLPRINRALTAFAHGWNYHPLSSESNKCPVQLYWSNLPPPEKDLEIHHISDDSDVYVDMEDDLIYFNEPNALTTPEPIPRLSPLEELVLSSFRPLQQCDDFGYGLFQSARNAVLMCRSGMMALISNP